MSLKINRSRYRCEFMLNNYKHLQLTAYSTEGIAAFKDGFWINADLKYTKGADAHYWIPPNAILYIAKENQP